VDVFALQPGDGALQFRYVTGGVLGRARDVIKRRDQLVGPRDGLSAGIGQLFNGCGGSIDSRDELSCIRDKNR
jgi:hypothetical protein